MIKKIKKIYNPDEMNRPLVHKIYSKFIIALVICLAWSRFIDHGERGLSYIFTIIGLLILIACWFNYLRLDGARVGHLMMGWKKKKRNVVRGNRDIADFTDEEVVDFDELEEDERMIVRFFSNIIVAVIFLLMAFVASFF